VTVDSSLGNDAQNILRQACAELRSRLRAGQPVRAESFLEASPLLASNPEWALDLIVTEVVVRTELGETVSTREVLERFPRWEEPLRNRLSILHLFDAPGSEDPTRAGDTEVFRFERTAEVPTEVPELGRHERFERIGIGGMGEVYRARDLVLGRDVALKIMRPEYVDGPEMVARFYREARAAARLRHPHIITIHAIGRWGDRHCFTMPLFGGGSLDKHKGRYPEDPRAAVALVEKVARAVQAAHEAGIIHRDLKPANILLDDAGEPVVGDFGLAKFADQQVELTQTGARLGTPSYMAPEQAAGHSAAATEASDVWSLGVILFELLTGRRPFADPDQAEVERLVRTADPPRPRTLRPGLPREPEAVLLRCLEKNPARRYPSAGALADDLGRWLRGEPVLARPPSRLRRCGRTLRRHPRLSMAVLLGSLLAAAIVLFLHFSDPDRPVAQAEAKLARGEAVTLIGETGPPRWSRWCPDREGALENNLPRDRTFTISSLHTAMLQLLRDPPESYRFSAEVRPGGMDPQRMGRVGIFLAWSRTSLGGADHDFFCTWDFVELPGLGTSAEWNLLYYSQATKFGRYKLTQHCFPGRAPADEPRWTELAVEVRAGGGRLFWEGQPVGKAISWDEIRAKVSRLRAGLKDGIWFDPFPTLVPSLGPQQPLGLFVQGTEASFRRVTVQPIR
jgi:hypothetical protein